MNEYMKKYGFKKAIFVDDNYNNLKTCDKYVDIKQILALWGNSQPNFAGYQENEALLEINQFFN